MTLTAIIGGSGFDTFDTLVVNDAIFRETPYGAHSGPALSGSLGNAPCLFLPRHGAGHYLPPHKVNYRANMWLLRELGVKKIISFNVVGGITPLMSPDTIVIPDQIIDYTYDREHTFYDGRQKQLLDETFQNVEHVDFAKPFNQALRKQIIEFFQESDIDIVGRGVYGCTQGPRLETAAEIERLQRDGCDIVGMTAMPEAALARELGIDYAAIVTVVNWSAGISEDPISMIDIMNTVKKNMSKIKTLLPNLLQFL